MAVVTRFMKFSSERQCRRFRSEDGKETVSRTCTLMGNPTQNCSELTCFIRDDNGQMRPWAGWWKEIWFWWIGNRGRVSEYERLASGGK